MASAGIWSSEVEEIRGVGFGPDSLRWGEDAEAGKTLHEKADGAHRGSRKNGNGKVIAPQITMRTRYRVRPRVRVLRPAWRRNAISLAKSCIGGAEKKMRSE